MHGVSGRASICSQTCCRHVCYQDCAGRTYLTGADAPLCRPLGRPYWEPHLVETREIQVQGKSIHRLRNFRTEPSQIDPEAPSINFLQDDGRFAVPT